MLTVKDVSLIVKRGLVVVVSTGCGVIVLVGVTVVDREVTVSGLATDVVVVVTVVVVAGKR